MSALHTIQVRRVWAAAFDGHQDTQEFNDLLDNFTDQLRKQDRHSADTLDILRQFTVATRPQKKLGSQLMLDFVNRFGI